MSKMEEEKCKRLMEELTKFVARVSIIGETEALDLDDLWEGMIRYGDRIKVNCPSIWKETKKEIAEELEL